MKRNSSQHLHDIFKVKTIIVKENSTDKKNQSEQFDSIQIENIFELNNDPYNKLIIQEIKAWIEENLFGCNDYKKIASKWQRFSTKWNNSIKPSSIVHQDTTDNEKHSRTFRDPSLICGTIHQERHLRGYSLKLYDAGVDDNNGFNNLGDTSFRHDRLKSMRPAKGNFKLKLRTKKPGNIFQNYHRILRLLHSGIST